MAGQNVDLELSSDKDQPILFNPDPYLKEVDKFYEEAWTTDNPALTILNKIKTLSAQITLTGLALAKLLYRMHEDWSKFGINEGFTDIVYSYVGKSPTTVDRYIQVWKMYAEGRIPEAFRQATLVLPIRSQVPIALALRQGHEISDEQWKELTNAPDYSSLREILRKVKHESMRRSGVVFIFKRNGDLVAIDNQGFSHFVGYLNIKEAAQDEVIDRCITRIIDNSYMIREE